jgi:hypothetical protein
MTDAELIAALEALDVPKMWQPPYSGIGKTAREASDRLTQLSEAHRRIADNPVTFSHAAAEVSRAALAQGQKEGR